jgi:hypothetical protein
MRGRSVVPRDNTSSRRRTSGSAVPATDIGDDFPHDDFAPDDLPVRDVSEDREAPQPAPRVRTKGRGRPVHASNEAHRSRGGEGVAPAPAHFEQPASTSAFGQEPTRRLLYPHPGWTQIARNNRSKGVCQDWSLIGPLAMSLALGGGKPCALAEDARQLGTSCLRRLRWSSGRMS